MSVSFDWAAHAAGGKNPALRHEAHFDSRVLRCFAERPPSVFSMLEAAVARAPQRPAIVDGEVRQSYTGFARDVGRLTAGLRAAGLRAGDRIVIMAGNRHEFITAFFAIQRLGAIAVPVSVREQSQGLSYVVGQCAAAALIVDPELGDRLGGLPGDLQVVRMPGPPRPPPGEWPASVIEWDSLFADDDDRPPHPVHEDDTAVLLYTSGTTGRPKGAMLSHLGIAHSVEHFRICMPLPEGVRMALAVPASHVTGLVAIIAAAVHCAGTVLLLKEFKSDAFIRLAEAERMQATILVPAMYRLCLMSEAFARADLSQWIVGGYGGAPMPDATIDELARRLPGLGLINAYGATETTSPATLMPAALTPANPDSVGQPLPCADIRVMDDDGREVPPGVTGELWIGGPMVVRGYWDNAQASAEAFIGGFWRSGDLGSVDAHGFVRVFDRKKDMINRGGYKIFSIEVENLLMAQPGVLEAAVVGRPCPVLGERVHAVVTVAEPAPQPDALRAACRSALADYKVPETFALRREPLPRNANGKVLKRLLKEADAP